MLAPSYLTAANVTFGSPVLAAVLGWRIVLPSCEVKTLQSLEERFGRAVDRNG